MKRFLTLVVILLVSITAKGQYVSKPTNRYIASKPSTVVQKETGLQVIDLPEYREAIKLQKEGKMYLLGGAITQSLGIGCMMVAYNTEATVVDVWKDGRVEYSHQPHSPEFVNGIVGLGAGLVIVGTVLEVTGVIKWSEGLRRRNEIMVSLQGTGIIVTF